MSEFGTLQFKAVRQDWLSSTSRSRQYVNGQMKRLRRVLKWAVAEGMLPPDQLAAIRCIEPLKRGRCAAPEAAGVSCVDPALVDATIEHLTPVLADMVQFQLMTGCRPGELCTLRPAMIDRSESVWVANFADHKTAYRGKSRYIYIGPKAQAILTPYLFRDPDKPCFSPKESEAQRRAAAHEARVTPASCGNRPGSNRTRKPRTSPGDAYNTRSYARAIKYACKRANLDHWSPNQLRHNAGTAIRKHFGIEAASVILGHSDVGVTQVYAERDRAKAVEIARQIG